MIFFTSYPTLLFVGLPASPEKVTTECVERDAMSVSWRKPPSDGGSMITDYIVERQELPSSNWTKVASVSSSKLSCKINYLIHGKEYRFRVSARNKVGMSEPTTGPATVMKSPFNGKTMTMLMTS